MGLLDDAIREHLELKRRRGADPTEIDRLEREALGPVRRSRQNTEGELFDDEEPLGGPYVADDDLPEQGDAGLFDHDAEDDFDAPPEYGAPADFEPPTEIATRQTLEPETDPGLRESPRHHEIAEEWQSHRRQAEEEAGVRPQAPGTGFEARHPDAEAEAPPNPPPRRAARPADEQPLPPRYQDPEMVEQETAEYHVEEEPEREDMLEETPEFLQDTPDHDRLWFEQRPPKDFDLEG